MQTFSAVLLENASATGGWVFWPGGRGIFRVGGTVGGATITLETKLPGPSGTAKAVGTNTTFTDENLGGFDLDPCELRVLVAGGSPSGLYATVARVPA